MAERFIAGSDATCALPVLHTLHRHGIAFTVDLLGEATLSDTEAAAYQARCATENTMRRGFTPKLQW